MSSGHPHVGTPGQASAYAPADATPPPRRRAGDPAVLAVIALGGVLGAEARYGMSVWLPHQPAQFPVATLLVNASGCFLIGVLMVVVTELTAPHRLMRPFLGVGILGGYTTFSTATVEVQQLAQNGRAGLALGYLLVTVVAALTSAASGMALTRAIGTVRVGRRAGRGTPP
jgi:fluoride exporter